MGRGRPSRGRQRDTSDIASSELLAPPELNLKPIRLLPSPIESVLDQVQDTRRYSPDRVASAFTVFGTPAPHRKVVGKNFARIGFDTPATAIVCVRRKKRREVLFAKRRRGKGSGARRRRMTEWSKFKC